MFRLIQPSLVGWMRGAASQAAPVFCSPRDMTDSDRIRDFIHWGEKRLEAGHRHLVMDLSKLDTMDCAFLAGIIHLSKRAHPLGAELRLIGVPRQFERLIKVYRVAEPLTRAGVIFEPELSADTVD